MSDTPRTDAEMAELYGLHADSQIKDLESFARQLERDLNAAMEIIRLNPPPQAPKLSPPDLSKPYPSDMEYRGAVEFYRKGREPLPVHVSLIVRDGRAYITSPDVMRLPDGNYETEVFESANATPRK